jgi:nucleoside-diphosphate-sugar epimerase
MGRRSPPSPRSPRSRGDGGVSLLLCFGFGYTAQHYAALYGARYDRIAGTTRSAANAAALAARQFGGRTIGMIVFDGAHAAAEPALEQNPITSNRLFSSARPPPRMRGESGDPASSHLHLDSRFCGNERKSASTPSERALAAAIADATAILVSVAPDGGVDPVLARWSDAIAAAPHLGAIVYLSTVAVYGNHDGRWIDETTPLQPALTRARDRIEAERAWAAIGAARGVPVAVIRVAGIYGPGANALEAVKAGRARRIVKPGQVFNRIHVADLAQIIDQAFARRADGVFNAADDEPTAPSDPIVYAATLLGVAPPPEVAFADAKTAMSPFAASFYGESKRVRNDRIKTELGVVLRYPTYREGLRALAAEQGGG